MISESCDIPIYNIISNQEEEKATDNGDNVIREIKVKNSENIVESDDDSAIDEQSEVEDEGAKKKRGKSSKAAKEFKEHKKKTKINVLPSEVCFFFNYVRLYI